MQQALAFWQKPLFDRSRDPSLAIESLMVGRLCVLLGLLSVVMVAQVFGGNFVTPFHLALGYGLLAVGFAFNLVHALFLGRVNTHWGLVLSHILFDTVLTSTWVYFSGGRESLYALLYLIHILIVGLVLYQKAALLTAVASSVGFGGVLLMAGKLSGATVLSWGIYSGLFVVLGLVGGYLSEELHSATQSLQAQKDTIARLRTFHERIIESLPTGWLTVDQHLRVNYINPAGAHILGREPEQIVGQNLSETAPALLPFFEAEGETSSEDEEVATSGDLHHRSFYLKTKFSKLQQTVEVENGAMTLRGDVAQFDRESMHPQLLDKRATHVRVLLFQDVTKIVKLEEDLKQHEKLAAVGQLAAGIAHEIRNPLASMSGSIELLKSTIPAQAVGGEEKKLMDIAIREIDRLNSLITEFLDFVKPGKIEFENVTLQDLLSDLVLSAKQHKERKQKIEIKEQYEAGAIAKASNEKLRQVVWNLIVNAIQAMPGAGTIEVGCSRVDREQVKLWVKDEGQGISDEVLHRLFEPFFTTKSSGTGLGLATAYKIVEAHEGEIKVAPQEKGTLFEVYLKAA